MILKKWKLHLLDSCIGYFFPFILILIIDYTHDELYHKVDNKKMHLKNIIFINIVFTKAPFL